MAGILSESWERIISMDIANQLVNKGTSEVRPRMFRVLAKISERDDEGSRRAMGGVKWLRCRDKSTDTNYVAPEADELETELLLFRAWHDRIRKYGND